MGGLDPFKSGYTHYNYYAQLESCAEDNLGLVSIGCLFIINIPRYCKLTHLYSSYDGCSGYQSDQSSNAPSIESLTSASRYSMDDTPNRPYHHTQYPSDGVAFLTMGELALGVPYGRSKRLAPSSLLEREPIAPFSAPGSWMPWSQWWHAQCCTSFFSFARCHLPPYPPFGSVVHWMTLRWRCSRRV